MKNSNKENGITLIALIVTIIIMLIIAGIGVFFLVGDNGILSKSKDASTKYSDSSDKENTLLANYNNYIDEKLDSTSRGINSATSTIITDINFSISSITDSSFITNIVPTVSTTENDIMGYHVICSSVSDSSLVYSKMSSSKTITIDRTNWF